MWGRHSDAWIIHLIWDEKTIYIRLRYPTKKDLKTLPIWNLTTKKDYSPQSLLKSSIQGEDILQPRSDEEVLLRRVQCTDEKIMEWKIGLGYKEI